MDFHKLQGIGTDNANVMVRIDKGVYQVLKIEVPHIILVKRVYHSVQLAAYAVTAGCLLDFIVSKTYNWIFTVVNIFSEQQVLVKSY
jgi:sulfur relay (sulfurtransferase) DsrF/TusC family protein